MLGRLTIGRVMLKRILTSPLVLSRLRKWEAFKTYHLSDPNNPLTENNHLSERGMLSQAFAITNLNQVKGDYLEFGLFRGRTFVHSWTLKRDSARDMHLWGFDSFEGLPEVKPREGEIWETGQYACSVDTFRSIITAQGMQPPEYTLVPGFFDQSLNEQQHQRMAGRTAAIVYIDCDLYESTVPVLAFIERYLQTGTVVCFDDFYCYRGAPDQGEQRALAEFLDQHPNIKFNRYLTYGIAGQSFMVYRTDA
jgi:hypothetical protein